MKTLILISLLSLISYPVFSQTSKTGQMEYAVSFVSLNKETRELKVTLAIINNSRQIVAIDKNGLLYSTEFKRLGERLENGGLSNGEARVSTADVAHPYEGDYVLIKPKASFEMDHTLRLDDPFFRSNRKYSFSVTYGQFSDDTFEGKRIWKGVIKSNEIKFEL